MHRLGRAFVSGASFVWRQWFGESRKISKALTEGCIFFIFHLDDRRGWRKWHRSTQHRRRIGIRTIIPQMSDGFPRVHHVWSQPKARHQLRLLLKPIRTKPEAFPACLHGRRSRPSKADMVRKVDVEICWLAERL